MLLLLVLTTSVLLWLMRCCCFVASRCTQNLQQVRGMVVLSLRVSSGTSAGSIAEICCRYSEVTNAVDGTKALTDSPETDMHNKEVVSCMHT